MPSAQTQTQLQSLRRNPFSLKVALAILALLNLARILFGLCFDLVPQEAYYFLYSQHPALSYFDHPPLMAWSLWLFTSIFGTSPFVLRLTAFTLTLLTQFAFFALARRFVPRAKLPHAILLFGTTAMVSVVSLISLPDVPLLLFWTLTLLCLERAIFGGRRAFWILAGLCMGLAFDGKYTAVFLQLGLALFLVLSKQHRRWLKTPWPYLAIALAHVAMLPVYVWNAQNGFASFLFQSSDRAATWRGLHPINFLKLLGSQSALLLPPLLFGIAWAFFRELKHLFQTRVARPVQQRPLFLLCFFAPLFLGFTALSFVTLVKPNWLMPAWITGILFASLLVSRRLTAWNLGLSLVLHVALALEIALYPVPLQTDDTWFGWKALSTEVRARQAEHPGRFLFADDGYKTSAELGFYLGAKTYSGNVLGKRGLQYDYLGDDLTALVGRDALFIDSRPTDFRPGKSGGKPPRKLVRHFDAVEEIEPILIRNRGKIARKFLVFRCDGYRGPHPIEVGAESQSKLQENASSPEIDSKKVEVFTLPDGMNVSIALPETDASLSQERDAGGVPDASMR
ncbi:MAG: glycosyltransferase family 39 protein [Myxococcales bacterium]|jgi:hypothetical protein|nr:glycosyltransferase family 39 protein [Myxococcales bacterium]